MLNHLIKEKGSHAQTNSRAIKKKSISNKIIFYYSDTCLNRTTSKREHRLHQILCDLCWAFFLLAPKDF